ncbi:MAG: SMC-Scp complex subunit ScpB [Bifidobacterium tibiigranuli]|jgi:segregation and condensation protein B|uniref:SMC-Scp complex subunit ScpB n=1 Tax=Bifidobacterium tibiigranuli TaxID=2172043 RepID=UPI0026F1D042|nr:SMC-Scp complex subunit ScpB [Bifidobacterium tibiigranuli]MCI1672765.1 SMC-Scp complex subunit ScpB [Bifidobacterium tibiigranuli]MCI1712230.1 SMC-Scp complex subunit ScpB [Bifidobacterium tibiigranuli]MCI1833228.1 SMC-Scp complex subunit ScpB [Bifidobacterium tibiigranuli]
MSDETQTLQGTQSEPNPSAAASQERDTPPARPEYVDFDVEDFPGGLRGCLEAILMVADQPQQSTDLARVLAVDEAQVDDALTTLQADYDGRLGIAEHGIAGRGDDDFGNSIDVNGSAGILRGFELRHTARGWQFANRADYEPVVAAFVTDGQTARLSQAALEALAIIAYRQPVTRAQVAAIRGVNSDGVIRSLVVRGLIREEGIDPESRAALLVTSGLFLEHMGLDSLDQLPSLAPFMPPISEMENTEVGHSEMENAEVENGGMTENAMALNGSERNGDII